MNIYDLGQAAYEGVKGVWEVCKGWVITILACVAVGGGFLYENIDNAITWVGQLQGYVSAIKSQVVAFPVTDTVGYVARVFPVGPWLAILAAAISLRFVALSIRLVKSVALWWSGG